MNVQCVFRANDLVGENPTWDWRSQRLYWVDNRSDLLRRLDPATGEVKDWKLPEFTGCFALTQHPSKILLGMRSGAVAFDVESNNFDQLAPAPYDPERFHLNDGHCDRAGMFVAGSNDRKKSGPKDRTSSIYQFDGARFRPIVPDVNISNGIAFSPDNKILYRSEFLDRVILAYDYDSAAGTAANQRTFAEIPEGWGFPDGAAVDSEGGYWIALYNGGRVVRFDSDGKLDREIAISAKQPTMVAFGGPDFRTVYVTSAQNPPNSDLGEDAGGLFTFEVDVPGLPEAFVTI